MTDSITAPPPSRSGTRLLPGYRVTEHLARGQALDVYAVWSTERGCLCVAKTLRPDRLDNTAERDRLLHEGRLLQRLSHPHLVRGYETHDGPPPTVILETLSGQTLGHLIAHRKRALPADDLVELGAQLASVVGYLHAHHTLHLDLKPSNIVAEAGRARVLDLSHARRPGPCPAGFGTREYMPPEQLTGGHVDTASDVYALGGVLYRAATRRRPFTATARDHAPGLRPPALPLRRRTALPASLIDLITTCLDPHPAARPTLPEILTLL